MTLAAKVNAWCANARRRLHKEIDRRAELAKGERPAATINRSLGQRYRDRSVEAREAGLRG